MMSAACPSGRTGALLYNECLLRYSDEYFASMQTDTDQDPFGLHVEANVGDMVSMNNTRWKMMDRLIAAPVRLGQQRDVHGPDDRYSCVRASAVQEGPDDGGVHQVPQLPCSDSAG
jgi:hypothetical protein